MRVVSFDVRSNFSVRGTFGSLPARASAATSSCASTASTFGRRDVSMQDCDEADQDDHRAGGRDDPVLVLLVARELRPLDRDGDRDVREDQRDEVDDDREAEEALVGRPAVAGRLRRQRAGVLGAGVLGDGGAGVGGCHDQTPSAAAPNAIVTVGHQMTMLLTPSSDAPFGSTWL